jgi:K+/H+ antiporter YhaU regulatory subunit KhtT
MDNKTIYVVIRYPKTMERQYDGTEFHIYSMQSSNKERMVAYYHEQKNRHSACQVHLVTRETARNMRKKWREMVHKKDRIMAINFLVREGLV